MTRHLHSFRPAGLLSLLAGALGCSGSNAMATSTGPGPIIGDSGAPVACASDPNLPKEPTIPTACVTLMASKTATSGMTPPDESNLDTVRIQMALTACAAGQSVKLAASGANNAFVSGPLVLPTGVTLWVDAGATLYASRNPSVYGATCGMNAGKCTALVTAKGAGSGIVGDGVIDGQGGEPMVGQTQSWWDVSDALRASNASAPNPALVQTTGATNFTMYRITLHNSPKFHVRIAANGFVVWGITILTPSTPTNSQGAVLSPFNARNTDGIDPGAGGAVSNGYIVYSKISTGDDQIAIKGASAVSSLTIAHNHFGSGHGMSIGSETNGGVSGIDVCDLTIDNSLRQTGSPSVDVNGIRIKSDSSRGGAVTNVTYTDVCIRDVDNPIVLNPNYSTSTGSLIPLYTNITLKNVHASSSSVMQLVTLDGFDSGHTTIFALDNVAVDGVGASGVEAQNANVTLGPGSVNFMPSGANVAVVDHRASVTTPIDCSARWVHIP
ncbi:MAG: glycosyl hydrolase family 28 protein [Myxococcota bacterium]|nr:glycosyl hydrolase family 28 protein [Myxococcota bacterium]